MQRRTFLTNTIQTGLALAGASVLTPRAFALQDKTKNSIHAIAPTDEQTPVIFLNVLKKAQSEQWMNLPIGERMVRFAKEMLDTPYIAATLEGEPEVCRAVLTGLDCVTLFESSLCFARILKKGKTTFNDFLNEITYTRYRDGKLTDYVSRLHYTTEWIENNVKKQVVKNVTADVGGIAMQIQLGIMSNNPKFYVLQASSKNSTKAIIRFSPKQILLSMSRNYKQVISLRLLQIKKALTTRIRA
jgi:hypothetical protein